MTKGYQDQRLFDRVNIRFPVRLSRENSHDCCNTVVRDVSAQGVRIYSPEKLSIFDRLSLSVDIPGSSEPLGVDGHVVWASGESTNSWQAGVKFDYPNLMKTGIILHAFQ
ncbi:MAG: PilZ domain-containing protein [Candidatus Omnitrophica bacterium]|nr:PilZ domain-containing protein [Candidatus Omnitrophota bacterium]